MINIAEILVVNISGALLLLMLPHLWIEDKANLNFGDRIFIVMRRISFAALLAEIFTFLLDGRPGSVLRVLSCLCNGYLFLASASVGLLWTIYVDYSIYRSHKRLKQRWIFLAIPFLCVALLVFGDLFGLGNIFCVTPENVYTRGPLVSVSYAAMFLYFLYSIFLTVHATKKGGYVLFPAYYFVVPCMVGTLVQGISYGIATGWFSVSIAFVMLQMRRQIFSAYVDELSGLNNRRYYNYFIDMIARSQTCKSISGIMIDINHFKSINDRFGHKAGDEAIRDLAGILSRLSSPHTSVFRLSGDEFVIISENLSEEETLQLIEELNRGVDTFNKKNQRPYQLSLAIGYHTCEVSNFNADTFFNRMDAKMYEAKAAYYSQRGKGRRLRDNQESPLT